MASEVEERIHRALSSHSLERTADGYRLVHPAGAGISTLRILPATAVVDGEDLVAVAEIEANYGLAGLPPFHATGVQRLNSWAVHGAYALDDDRLRQTAQFSIYAKEPAVHLAVQTILNAFGAQLPIGRSTALATVSEAALKQQRAHHAMRGKWRKPLEEAQLQSAAQLFQEQGLAASSNATALWAEFPLSGDCPSRSVDPDAETALLQVNAGIAHPIAGAGYLATVALPLKDAVPNAAALCGELNRFELWETDFVPRLGAWGLHAPHDVPAYSCFIPAPEPVPAMHTALMWWCVRRAAWIRSRFWAPQRGLRLEGAATT